MIGWLAIFTLLYLQMESSSTSSDATISTENSTIARESIILTLDLYKEEDLKEKVSQILKIQGNNECVDCSQADPEWSSVNLGVTLCINCSGIHRNLGVHISRVKSLFLDNWKKEELEILRDNGNILGRAIWECKLPKFFSRPGPKDSVTLREQFIRAKYERKEFIADSEHFNYSEFPHKEGFLVKQGIVVKNWKKRWFKLSGTLLFYYKKQKDIFEQGIIPIRDTLLSVTKIDFLSEPMDNRNFCFTIHTPGREFFMSADSAKETFDWIKGLRIAKAQLSEDKPLGKRASEIDGIDLLPKMIAGLCIQKRKHSNKKTYPDCFIGTAAIDWLMFYSDIVSRPEAVLLCQRWMDTHQICNVIASDVTFADDYTSLYQVTKIENNGSH